MSEKKLDFKEVLKELNQGKCSHETKLKLAKSVETPIEIFQILLNDNVDIKKELAKNIAVPEPILYQLAKDADCQLEVADNEKVSPRVLDSLVRFSNSSSSVKLSVLSNERVSFKTVSFLKNDKDVLVSKTASDLCKKYY